MEFNAFLWLSNPTQPQGKAKAEAHEPKLGSVQIVPGVATKPTVDNNHTRVCTSTPPRLLSRSSKYLPCLGEIRCKKSISSLSH